jgi:hypothetical protein
MVTNDTDAATKFLTELVKECQWTDPDMAIIASIESSKKRIWTPEQFNPGDIKANPKNIIILNTTERDIYTGPFECINVKDMPATRGSTIPDTPDALEYLRNDVILANINIADKYDTDLLYETENRTPEEQAALDIYQCKYELTDLRPSLVVAYYLSLTGRKLFVSGTNPSQELVNNLQK